MVAPPALRSDCKLQLTSSHVHFLSKWGVTRNKSTPYYPQSNGLVEATVKCIEKIILILTINGNLDKENFQKSLQEKVDGLSPAQIVFGNPLRSLISTHLLIRNFKLHDLNLTIIVLQSEIYQRITTIKFQNNFQDLK